MKNITKTIALLSLLFFSISCNNESNDDVVNEAPELTSKIGVWEGEGQQPGISWTIKITLNKDEQLIEYPSLECGGFLTLIEEREGLLLFRETITFNTICADQGFVELIETSSTTMDYNYYYPSPSNEKGQLGATGSVSKSN